MIKKTELPEYEKRNLYRRAVHMYEKQGASQNTITNVIFHDLKDYYLIDRAAVSEYVSKSLYHYVMSVRKECVQNG